jgi:hypothetical protein
MKFRPNQLSAAHGRIVGLNSTTLHNGDRACDVSAGLPTFLVIGAQRAGTTLLHRVLEAHPEVFVPYRRKEVHYFDRYWDRGVDWYAQFFPPEDEAGRYRAIGEVTPDYLFEPQVPRLIHDLLPDCRLIVSLRNPVDRAYSSYLYSLRSRNERRSFAEVVSHGGEVVARGFYAQQLERYLQLFPRNALLVLIFEEIVESPREQFERIRDFLGLERSWEDPGALTQERVNPSEIPRFRAAFAHARRLGALLTRSDLDWVVRLTKRSGIHKLFGRRVATPPMAPSLRQWLQVLYCDEITALETMLGRELPSWRVHRGEPRLAHGAPAE